MEIQYIGEHLVPGFLGRSSLMLAFLASLFALFAYYRASNNTRPDWRKWRNWARRAYLLHTLMVILASALLLYLLLNRYYEYRYVWAHVENDLGLGYMISSFWAGQEGSFLFWILCQAIFGVFMIRHAREWESPVMTLVSLSQAFMITMVLGASLGGLTIGMSPFMLLREAAGSADNPFFQNPHYVSMIADGNGLNPLLRNFWMMSHPPFTFIGYASVLIPCCFAIAGLWKRQYHSWIQPALPWTVLGVFFLGIGIILGGVWAYESLTFGGFWAWDPIENASLVPWLILVAGLHLMLISKNKKHSYFPAFLFTILSFILVVYATYLTRSGVLSETSVHSFGNDGMGRHILIYIFTLLTIAIVLLIRNYRHMPSKNDEEPFTREFWLFVGSLVLVLSAFQIIFTTSIPVLNKFFGTALAPPTDVVSHYNNWQLPFAVVIAALMGFTHFIKWGKNDMGAFLKSIFLSVGLTLIASILIATLYGVSGIGHLMMLFASLFALFSSLDLLLRFRRQFASAGAMVSHLGVALFLLAVLLTFSKKSTISQNTSGYFMGQQFAENENLLLIQGEVLPMGPYHVVYTGKTFDGSRLRYQVDFLKTNKEGDFYKAFTAWPAILLNERMGNVYEPFSRIYPLRDIFTYVTFADVERDLSGQSITLIETIEVTLNDTITIDNNRIILEKLSSPSTETGQIDPENLSIVATLRVETHFGKSYTIQPVFLLTNGQLTHEDDTIADMNLQFRFKNITEKPYTIILEIFDNRPEFIIIKTVIFPLINLLWFSMVVMLVGIYMAYYRRWKIRGSK